MGLSIRRLPEKVVQWKLRARWEELKGRRLTQSEWRQGQVEKEPWNTMTEGKRQCTKPRQWSGCCWWWLQKRFSLASPLSVSPSVVFPISFAGAVFFAVPVFLSVFAFVFVAFFPLWLLVGSLWEEWHFHSPGRLPATVIIFDDELLLTDRRITRRIDGLPRRAEVEELYHEGIRGGLRLDRLELAIL
jgi:hypothetical protein